MNFKHRNKFVYADHEDFIIKRAGSKILLFSQNKKHFFSKLLSNLVKSGSESRIKNQLKLVNWNNYYKKFHFIHLEPLNVSFSRLFTNDGMIKVLSAERIMMKESLNSPDFLVICLYLFTLKESEQ